VDQVILIAPGGASGALRGLVDRLASIGVTITIVDAIAAAAEASARERRPPAVMLDLREAGEGGEVDGDEALRKVTDAVRHTLEALPHALPIVLTAGATPALILAAIRAGAADLIDVQIEGTSAARAVVQRICQRQADRQLELAVMEEQRAIVEELLRDLIRTERRAIDGEEALAAQTRTSRAFHVVDARPPAVMIVDSDRAVADDLAERLEAAGVAAFAYLSGEDATREAAGLAASSGLDLALVAAQLPGIDGLETVRLLRERSPDLPAFLMTVGGSGSAEFAEAAATVGVTGFLQKPFADVEAVIDQLADVARESRHRTRESLYLQRIKERHEHVLERYRSLPRAP
jgi:CheY-like chemotaxis protein